MTLDQLRILKVGDRVVWSWGAAGPWGGAVTEVVSQLKEVSGGRLPGRDIIGFRHPSENYSVDIYASYDVASMCELYSVADTKRACHSVQDMAYDWLNCG